MAYRMAASWASFSAKGLPSELGYSTVAEGGGERAGRRMGGSLVTVERRSPNAALVVSWRRPLNAGCE